MNFIRTIVWKEFLHIKADPLMVRLILFPVLVQLLVVGYALTVEVRNTPIGVLDHSRSPESRDLVGALAHNPLFRFKGDLDDLEQAGRMLDAGVIKLALIVPADFARALRQPDGASVKLLVDGVDANSSNVARGYLAAIVSQWAFDRMEKSLAARGIRIESQLPVSVNPTILFNPMLNPTWYMVPGLVVILVTMVTSLLTAFSIVKEKEKGTLEQLLVTPIRSVHIIAGKCIPFLVIGLVEIMIFLVLATLWFGIPFRGSVLTLLGFGVLYMVSSLGIGILTSTIARNAQQVLFIVWFFMIFFILLSGFFVPVENMPGWVQVVTHVNPVRFYMEVVRSIFLKGAGLSTLWREGIPMIAIGIVVFSVALLSFHRKAS